MKIAFIIQNYNYNGGGQVTASLAKYFETFGHNVSVIVIRCDKEDIQSRPNNFSNIIDLYAHNLQSSVFKLSKIFRNSDYGLFICVGDYSNLVAGLAKLCSRSSTTLIGSEHFGKSVLIGDYKKPLLRLSLPLYKLAYMQLNGLVFVSDSLKSEFLKKNSWHPSRCVTIYNPVRSFKKKSKKNKDFKSSGITFLGMGVLETRKRFDLLLNAFSIVAGPNDKLLIAGTGTEEEKLKNQAKNLGIFSQVKFLGFVSDVDSLMQNSDILVLTSNSEALPMVLLEGLTAGLQIVSTNSFSGPAEVLENGRYGYLAEVDNIDSIISTIKKIKNKPIPTNLIEEGASRFKVDQIAHKYFEFISTIMMNEGNINEAI